MDLYRRMTCSNLKARYEYNLLSITRSINKVNRLFLGWSKPLRELIDKGEVKIDLFCDECGKHIPSDAIWVCGYCDTENHKTINHSFLTTCERCARAPLAYQCPHCGSLNFLEKKKDIRHPAKIILSSETTRVEVDPMAEKTKAYLERKAELEREIEITELSARLERLKESAGFKVEKSAREQLEKSFSAHDAHAMGAQIIAREKRTENAERFKDEPELLAMANESVQAWLESQL